MIFGDWVYWSVFGNLWIVNIIFGFNDVISIKVCVSDDFLVEKFFLVDNFVFCGVC